MFMLLGEGCLGQAPGTGPPAWRGCLLLPLPAELCKCSTSPHSLRRGLALISAELPLPLQLLTSPAQVWGTGWLVGAPEAWAVRGRPRAWQTNPGCEYEPEASANLPALPSCPLGPAAAPGTGPHPSMLGSQGVVAMLL